MQGVQAQQRPTAAQVEAALQVFLANWPEAANGGLSTVCALLQVSTASQRAVQQATASCSVNFYCQSRINKAADFAAWLPRHPGVVRNLFFGELWGSAWRAGEQLLHGALLQYLAQRMPGPTGVAASNSPALALSHLTTPWIVTPAVFSTLAAVSSVTSLRQDLRGQPPPSAAVCAALGVMTGLKKLQLTDNRSSRFHSKFVSSYAQREGPAPVMPPVLAATIQQLPQLQILYTETPMHPEQLRLLPPSLNELSVILGPAQDDAAEVHVDLRHLTDLTSLALQCAAPVSAQSALPDSVLKLCIEGGCHAVASTGLQSLKLCAPHLCMELVSQVSRMPELRQLEIELDNRFARPRTSDMVPVTVAISTATQLTGLTLDLYNTGMVSLPRTARLQLGVCLEGLVNLERLLLSASRFPDSDLVKLTALTKLTRLSLSNSGASDLAVSALACKLLRLQVLELRSCGMRTQAFLPPIAALPDLRQLDLEETDFGLNDLGLMQLTSLTKLSYLWLGERQLTAEGVDAFLLAMPRLSQTGSLHNVCVLDEEEEEEEGEEGGDA